MNLWKAALSYVSPLPRAYPTVHAECQCPPAAQEAGYWKSKQSMSKLDYSSITAQQPLLKTQRWIFHDMHLEVCDWFVCFQPIIANFKLTLTPLATRPSRVLKVSLWPFANLVESFLSWKEGKMFRPSWWHVFPNTLWMLYAKILSQIPSKVSISRSSDFTYFVFFFSL